MRRSRRTRWGTGRRPRSSFSPICARIRVEPESDAVRVRRDLSVSEQLIAAPFKTNRCKEAAESGGSGPTRGGQSTLRGRAGNGRGCRALGSKRLSPSSPSASPRGRVRGRRSPDPIDSTADTERDQRLSQSAGSGQLCRLGFWHGRCRPRDLVLRSARAQESLGPVARRWADPRHCGGLSTHPLAHELLCWYVDDGLRATHPLSLANRSETREEGAGRASAGPLGDARNDCRTG